MRKVRRKSGGISFLTALICILCVVVGILCLTRYINMHRQKERLLAENASLIAQSEALSDRLKQIRAQEEFGKDESYVESVARAQLDMVYPGEVIFRVTGEKYN
ncbi:FtsB family cell division protein [Butyrivibrio sp. AE2032]|uniref:FtsB family cell division protein n=1 Tax=Butyrivibrio sp. AE2032 TaxID=1458463 RepID=UPI0005582DC9|nr:septum formation initiator family protein [Butyrivibrio sp. AE2032]